MANKWQFNGSLIRAFEVTDGWFKLKVKLKPRWKYLETCLRMLVCWWDLWCSVSGAPRNDKVNRCCGLVPNPDRISGWRSVTHIIMLLCYSLCLVGKLAGCVASLFLRCPGFESKPTEVNEKRFRIESYSTPSIQIGFEFLIITKAFEKSRSSNLSEYEKNQKLLENWEGKDVSECVRACVCL